MANRVLVDGRDTIEGWRETEEASVQTTFTLTYTVGMSVAPSTAVPLTFTLSSLLAQVQGSYAAYLVIKRIVLYIERPPYSAWQFLTQGAYGLVTKSVPNGGAFTTFQFFHTSLLRAELQSFPTGVTIPGNSNISLNAHTFTTNPPIPGIQAVGDAGSYDFRQLFDDRLGFTNPSQVEPGVGIDFGVQIGNTSGSAQNVTYAMFGTDYVSESAQFQLDYVDWTNRTHHLDVYDDLQNPARYQMDLLIPIPLLDPGQTGFGELLFTLIQTIGNLPSYTVDLLATFAIAYLVDQ